MFGDALAYLITFRTYGSWLPGDEKGHVSRKNNLYQTPVDQGTTRLYSVMHDGLNHSVFILSTQESNIVLQTIIQSCLKNNWDLHATHVRTNHVHLLVTAHDAPEIILTKLKSACSKDLNVLKKEKSPRWARHGSTRYLFKEQDFYAALNYVVHEQGKKMALFVSDNWRGIL